MDNSTGYHFVYSITLVFPKVGIEGVWSISKGFINDFHLKHNKECSFTNFLWNYPIGHLFPQKKGEDTSSLYSDGFESFLKQHFKSSLYWASVIYLLPHYYGFIHHVDLLCAVNFQPRSDGRMQLHPLRLSFPCKKDWNQPSDPKNFPSNQWSWAVLIKHMHVS